MIPKGQQRLRARAWDLCVKANLQVRKGLDDRETRAVEADAWEEAGDPIAASVAREQSRGGVEERIERAKAAAAWALGWRPSPPSSTEGDGK